MAKLQATKLNLSTALNKIQLTIDMSVPNVYILRSS